MRGEKAEAMKVERFIKSLKKKSKAALIKAPKQLENLLLGI